MPSTVVATVLFTDLVGSTALSTSLSAEAAEAVRQTHFALLRSAIQSTGGVEVKNLGDGLMVSFTSPSRAIACAVGIQQGVDNHNRRAAQPLSIRVGVSAGEVTEDDGDYFGDPVVEAARLCAAADGGQILAAEVVRAMVGRHATQTFVEVGPLDLKGLPHPVDAVEVVWEPEVVPGTVPLPSRLLAASNDAVFGFVGRAEELTEVDDALKSATAERQARTVLIAGEAGIGKTALVAQVARGVHARGVTVLLGRCTEELLVPYQPWIEVMGHLVEHRPELMESVSPAHRAALDAVPAQSPRRRRVPTSTPKPSASCSSRRSCACSSCRPATGRRSWCSTTCTGRMPRACRRCATSWPRRRPSPSSSCARTATPTSHAATR